MNSKAFFADLLQKISLPEDNGEKEVLGLMIMESVFGMARSDIMMDKPVTTDESVLRKLKEVIQRLNAHEPIQYILGKADFFGRTFLVTPAVLIPRPETEELVLKITQPLKLNPPKKAPTIIDIGTGSGCIPITIKLELPMSRVIATDISEGSLAVAKKNAQSHEAEVEFTHHNFLSDPFPVREADVIVSNPPYIPVDEKKLMNKNVVDHEPALALFVPDDDPLVFYSRLAAMATQVLNPSGRLGVEIHERYGKAVQELFLKSGLKSVIIHKDINGKDRIVTARK